MAMSADLGEALERYVTDLVDSGRYGSRNEILRESMRLFQERETRLAELDASIRRGIADADAGRVIPMDEAFDRVEEKLKTKAQVPQR